MDSIIECQNCQKPYDFSRIPFELPCGHSFCEGCLRTFHATENKFLCFADNKTYDLTMKDLPIPNFYHFIVKQLTEIPNYSYMCSKHKNEPMRFICDEHKEFLCYLCIWDHSDHKNSTKAYYEEDLIQDIQRVELKLAQMNETFNNLKERLYNIRIRKIFHTADIKSFFYDAEKFLVHPFCKTMSEEKTSFPMVVASSNSLLNSFFDESVIINQALNKDFLVTMFEGQTLDQTKLLFRATMDGWKSNDFHKLCDNKGPTLVLVKDTNGYYFGGFNTSDWDKKDQWKSAPGSFLFSLNHKTKHEIYQNEKESIYNGLYYGPTFGGTHDLYIAPDCNQNTLSHSDLGFSYQSPYQYDTDQSRNYLAGSYHFEVVDYEVFSIKFVKK